MKTTISAIIITKNEEKMIANCIQCLQWCNEIVVIDDSSTDKTASIAENLGAKVVSFSHPSFARKRQEGIKRSRGEWLIYIDADERVLPLLAKEIQVNIETESAQVFSLQRKNLFYGQELQHGGWGVDTLERVFYREVLDSWQGDIHEGAKHTGTVKELKTQLIHLSHRDTISGLYKTAAWTPMEAKALYEARVPKVTFFTLLRKGVMEFIRRAVIKKGYKDGEVGLVEAVIQAVNRVLVYVQVWELQQKPSIPEKYDQKEKEILELWQKEN